MTNPKISGPRLARVLTAAVRAEHNPGLLVVPIVRQGFGAPEGDVVIGAVREQVPFFTVGGVPRHWDIRDQPSYYQYRVVRGGNMRRTPAQPRAFPSKRGWPDQGGRDTGWNSVPARAGEGQVYIYVCVCVYMHRKGGSLL